MTVDDLVKLLDACTRLVGALAWPVLAGLVLLRFGPALRPFFESLSEFTLKGAGFEASARRQQAEAAAALAAAAATRPDQPVNPQSTALETREAVELVAEVVTPRVLRRTSRATILWVDDRPDNNVYERQSLEALGVRFVLARSTDEALEKVGSQPFDAVISDMSRPLDTRAAYTLLERLRAAGNQTPFIIYADSDTPEHRIEARQHGAFGLTNRAPQLFEFVLAALRRPV